jgi:hypothetical protein
MDSTTTLAQRLRDLAAWLEPLEASLPEQPAISTYATGFDRVGWYLDGDDQKATAAAIVKAVGGRWNKWDGDNTLYLSQRLPGGIELTIACDKGQTCTRRVVATRTVERVVPAVEAQPEHTVVETVEDVEWDCGPILAGAAS